MLPASRWICRKTGTRTGRSSRKTGSSSTWIAIEIGRFPTLDELRTPLYPQLTLSILQQRETKAVSPEAVSPMDLQVDYVRVYARVGRR